MKAADDAATLSPAEANVADSGLKSMVPLGDRPFLDYILSSLADAGCARICLVIGPEHGAIRERYTKEAQPRRFAIDFAIQEKPLGTGNAVLAASAFVGEDEFLMTNSDNYYPVDVLRTLVRLGRPGTVLFGPDTLAAKSNIEPARILAFALGKVGVDGCLDALVEKPDADEVAAMGKDRLVSMNCWRFPSAIMAACAELKPSKRGELELTDAIVKTIANGVRYKVGTSRDGVLDLSKRGDIPALRGRLTGVTVAL